MSALASFGVGVVGVLVALLLRLAADPVLGARQPFPTFYVAVAVTSWLGGWRAAVLASVLGFLAGCWFFLPPRGAISFAAQGDVVGAALYAVVCGSLILLTELMRRADRRSAEHRLQMEREAEQRRRSEAALRASEERATGLLDMARSVMRNMAEGLYTVDAQGLVTFINPAAERLFGWPSAELLGRKMHDVTHYKRPDGSAFPADECAGLQVLQEGTPLVHCEDVFIRKDGSFFPVVFSSSRLESAGRVAGLVVVFRDVTTEKQAEAERAGLLAEAERGRKEAEAASGAMDAFLATISHELRTPLSPILAWSRMLAMGALDPQKTARAVETIERCARAQAQLVEDLLDSSRIVAGKLRLDVRPVDLEPVVQAAIDVVRPGVEAKGIRLQTMLDPRAGQVSGDADRLQQIVWNLLSNAVKFTPKGGRVLITLRRVNSHVEIAVSDSGQGFAPEFAPHLFERFRQADGSSTRLHTGLGLGLAIVRQLVELHGGSVRAESPGPGQGAVFTVNLPLAILTRPALETDRRYPGVPAESPLEDGYASLAGLRILVVDDDPDSNEAVRTLFASCGAEVRVGASTAQALDILSRWKADVLVSDVEMPDEDGYALIRKVRQHDGQVAGLLAIALTAYASVDDRVRLLSAGFQAHVSKPADPAELVAVVASLSRDIPRS